MAKNPFGRVLVLLAWFPAITQENDTNKSSLPRVPTAPVKNTLGPELIEPAELLDVPSVAVSGETSAIPSHDPGAPAQVAVAVVLPPAAT